MFACAAAAPQNFYGHGLTYPAPAAWGVPQSGTVNYPNGAVYVPSKTDSVAAATQAHLATNLRSMSVSKKIFVLQTHLREKVSKGWSQQISGCNPNS